MGRVRGVAPGAHRGRHGGDQGEVRVRLRGLPPRASHRPDRVSLSRRRVAPQGDRAGRARAAAATRQHERLSGVGRGASFGGRRSCSCRCRAAGSSRWRARSSDSPLRVVTGRHVRATASQSVRALSARSDAQVHALALDLVGVAAPALDGATDLNGAPRARDERRPRCLRSQSTLARGQYPTSRRRSREGRR